MKFLSISGSVSLPPPTPPLPTGLLLLHGGEHSLRDVVAVVVEEAVRTPATALSRRHRVCHRSARLGIKDDAFSLPLGPLIRSLGERQDGDLDGFSRITVDEHVFLSFRRRDDARVVKTNFVQKTPAWKVERSIDFLHLRHDFLFPVVRRRRRGRSQGSRLLGRG